MKSKLIILILFLSIANSVFAQNDLLDKLNDEHQNIDNYTMLTFKGTRISIGHSVETRKKNTLEISFMSRYWDIPNSNGKSFIADRMSVHFGLDYGISDRLTFGVGYGAGKPSGIVDTYLKYRLFRQTIDDKNPLSVTLLQAASYRTRFVNGIESRTDFGSKLAFSSQILIARKFSRNFSLQIAPTFIHRTSSRSPLDDHNQFAIGFGARYKVSNHVAIASEYYYVANELESRETFGAFSLGVNWEVSKLLLQFKMTNNPFFNEDTFITQTTRNFNFNDGNLFFGFHATYHLQF
ncbi:DUF5777 family beta-barrel protein [Kordia algicida OT-1]|uniref:DUF5777 domain-containing protein n=1 Tax=Kordia algicida OT-1 TaxID=391587 RepID=A9E4B9_9FLAO|nr:DUF5777 family beta-barrel protein [Kordia algicida]EDP95345.1 hypothetical protein KAOT1_09741 [Kordia algicida OT-1]